MTPMFADPNVWISAVGLAVKRRKPTPESDQMLSDYERSSNPTYD